MARNYEKNFGQLNRWWLSQNDTKQLPKRPRLADLNSVEEIQRWLPSVKEEMNHCLTQSQVPCYTDKKVGEYHKHVLKLEIEYKRMLKKAKSLDAKAVICNGKIRPYKKKRKDVDGGTSTGQIELPVLDLPENQPQISSSKETEPESFFENNDSPLIFESSSTATVVNPYEKPKHNILGLCYSSSDDDT